MDPTERDSQSSHLQSLAFAELDVANRKLMAAGRTIDELRSDVLALAARVDGARAEAESFRNETQSLTQLLAQQSAASTEQQEALASQISENTAIHVALEAHIARLKLQLARPEKLLVKKVLRRGPYSTPDAT